jgi:cytochrome c oxidase cbb3-type subunit III
VPTELSMKGARIAATIVLGVAVSGLAAQNAGQEHPEQYSPADIATGSRIYNTICVSCHGPTGAGVGTVDLRRWPLPRASTDAALGALITNGIPGTGMLPFRLDANELRGVIAFIRAGLDTNSAAPVPGNAARGREIFEGRGNCLSCHRVNDKGSYSGPDLTDIGQTRTPVAMRRTLIDPAGSMRPINRPVRAVRRDGTIVRGRRVNEDTYTVQIMTDTGRLVSLVKTELRDWSVTTTSPMPSYKDSLTPEALADLVAYLVSLKEPRP